MDIALHFCIDCYNGLTIILINEVSVMKKILTSLFLISALSTTANAGFYGLTFHSRANCTNNESVAWDWTRYRTLWTSSEHIDYATGAIIHVVATQWEYTWRSAAVHFNEGYGGWAVNGIHWLANSYNQVIELGREYVINCGVYDGWWDRNK
jgi:hypothetical protein